MAAKMREPCEYAYFTDQVKPLLGDGVDLVGEITNGDKLALLGGATALLNPIRWPEPFGLVMTEALACGTPVITCPIGAAPEIVDDGVTGFLRGNHDALVDAVGRNRRTRPGRLPCRGDQAIFYEEDGRRAPRAVPGHAVSGVASDSSGMTPAQSCSVRPRGCRGNSVWTCSSSE